MELRQRLHYGPMSKTGGALGIRASGAGTSQAAEARDSIEKPFSHWIRGPRVVAASWKDDLEARFALVDCVEEAGPVNPHPQAAGPSKTWFLQFIVRIHSKYKFNCYNSHVPLIVETIYLNCLCSLPFWLRMPMSTV